MLEPWWERWPGRLEWELEALDRAGIPYTRDRLAEETGVIQLEVRPVIDGKQHKLIAFFPDTYPEFRFEVFAPDFDLKHHQNPFTKSLCLIGRATENWQPEDTLAGFLCERLPIVLSTGRSDEASTVAGIEEEQAEPFSDYYRYHPPSMILVDGAWALDPAVSNGKLVLALEGSPPYIRGAVLEVQDERGKILVGAEDAIARRFASSQRLQGRWVRSDQEIRQCDGKPFLKDLRVYDPRIADPRWQPLGGRQVDVVAVVFPEETRWRQTGQGWVFLERVRVAKEEPVCHFVRAGYAGRQDLAARVPELAPLAECRIVVVGLGALGMPSALALARAGVGELRCIDHDIVQPGTTPRWPLGLGAVGFPKAVVLERFVAEQYPYTRVKPFTHRIGSVRGPKPEASDSAILAAALDGAHLVYDATAEEGVHSFLDRLCRKLGIPFVCLWGTNGAWGGTVLRIRSGTGCWHCFLAGLMDESVPSPAASPDSLVQPIGCANPTFTGAGFDLESVALMGVRLAVGTLVGGMTGGYPDVDWDVAVGDFRNHDGQSIPPRWQTFPLRQRLGCRACDGL